MGNFPYKRLEEIQQEIQKLHIDMVSSEDASILFRQLEIEGLKQKFIPNRLVIHPMEGFDASSEGDPTPLTHTRYQRFGSSGAGIVWFEAVAVVPEGRSNPHQLYITEQNTLKFKELVNTCSNARTHLLNQNPDLPKEKFQNPLKILQLTHSGRYSKPGNERHPLRVIENPQLDAAMNIRPESGEIVSDEYLTNLQEKYLNAIEHAKKAGFDGVDIKSCHGYLISELLGSYKRSNSSFGGESIQQRSKFLLDIVRRSSQKFPDLIITVRINLFDALPYPYGFNTKEVDEFGTPNRIDLTDLHSVLDQLYAYGVRVVSFSAGNPYFKPYLSRPFVQNAFNGPKAPEHPLFSIERIITCLREISEKHPNMKTIGTAFSWLRQFSTCIAAGEIKRKSFDMIGLGRMAFAHPQFPLDIYRTGMIDAKKACISCSKCTEMMRMGTITGCVVRNPDYLHRYREAFSEYKKKQ